jgi:hypothetical protein
MTPFHHMAKELARQMGGAQGGGDEEDEPEWLREAGELVGLQVGHRGEEDRAGTYAAERGGRGGRDGRGGRGGRGGLMAAASRDAASAVRRLAFERVTTAVDREFDALVGSGAVGGRAGNMGRAEAGTQVAPRVDEAATMTAAPGMAGVGVQATATVADVATQAAGSTLSLSPCPPSRASQTDLGGDDVAIIDGARRGSGGRQRRAERERRQGLVAGARAQAREELELLTGVTAEEVERRLESARERFCERNWGWGDDLDGGALA